VSAAKQDKETAFLQDLYVATDWGERFAEIVDEHVKLPKKGNVLYVEAGSGGHALRLQERGGNELSIIGTDENEQSLELARVKAAATKATTDFRKAQLESLGFEDDQFDLVIGDASLVTPERIPEMLTEMVRVAVPGAVVALSLTTSSSFGEFFSIYWEALLRAGFEDYSGEVESLIRERPTVTEIEKMASAEGLDSVSSWTSKEEFDFASGEEFLNAPLIANFLLRDWLASIPDEARAPVSQEIAALIDEDRHEGEFALSVKATLVVGTK
jgi:ubiquinone/menaquinone biosynthesis C-methylase UbiE